MKPEIKKLWVKALRSGEYKQGHDALRPTPNTFCCLGVLCNLHAQAHPKIAAKQKDPEQYLGKTYSLPDAVMKWSGIKDKMGDEVCIHGDYDRLANFNDGDTSRNRKVTFKTLANAIEEQL